jgi:hypothetical protein
MAKNVTFVENHPLQKQISYNFIIKYILINLKLKYLII